MISRVAKLFDRLRGTGDHSVTTPPMDGALQPNEAIEKAALLADLASPDNFVRLGDEVLVSSGPNVFRLADLRTELHRFAADVTALACSPAGALAAGLENGSIALRGGRHDGIVIEAVGGRPLTCPTAIVFEDEATLLVCLGSARNAPSRWRHDLMQRERSGSVWRLRIGAQAERLADGLGYPCGIALDEQGRVIVAEAWASRLLSIDKAGQLAPVLSNIPGYPARLVARKGGGAWLTVFAPRSQLMEFVLRERDYCETMMRDVAEEHWIAPSLTSPRSFLEPLQGGALKQHGRLKPWAPTRSFGLVILLDERFRPTASWHSRADGTRHGITSCLETADGALLLTSKGGDALVRLDVREEIGK